MPVVSIVIPCYNHGHYLDDALESLESAGKGLHVEIIIVNDGSTEKATQKKLAQLEADGYQVIHQKNGGLASARNAGIRAAQAEIILPLDADNKITEIGISLPLALFEKNPDVSVIYGDRLLFEAQSGQVTVGDFNLQKLMLGNYIDACAMFRKKMWEALGGYDHTMPFTGWEDWEFWLHASFRGFKFHYLPEVLFNYRVVSNSMVHGLNKSKQKLDALLEHLEGRHPNHFGSQYVDRYFFSKFEESAIGAWGKLLLKRFFPGAFNKLVSAGKLRKYW